MKNLLKLTLATAVLFQSHVALAFQITPAELEVPLVKSIELEELTTIELQELLSDFYKTLTESDLLFFSSQIVADHRTNGDRGKGKEETNTSKEEEEGDKYDKEYEQGQKGGK